MKITDPLILPSDVLFIPVKELSPQVRDQFEASDDDFAITRPHARAHSKIVDLQTIELLNHFRTAKTIVQAVIDFSKANEFDADQTLEEAFPLIQQLMQSQLLVLPDSKSAQPIQQQLRLGEEVDGYTIEDTVQVLDDTEIYRVRSKDDARVAAALKIMREKGNENQEHKSVAHMFEREQEILRLLDGSICPRLFAHGIYRERPYLIIEWCPGMSAETAAAQHRPLPVLESRRRLLELCIAIATAYTRLHEHHIVHADVHPRNIIVAEDGSVKLIDFGLSCVRGSGRKLGRAPRGGIAFFFESEYAAARLTHKQPPHASYLGEQYGVAALLYLLVTGSHYLNFSIEKTEMLRQIAGDSPLSFDERGAHVWPELERVLNRALSKIPAARFASMAAFAEALNHLKVTLAASRSSAVQVRTINSNYSGIESVFDAVMRQVAPTGVLFVNGIQQAPTCSINYGMAGIAHLLYRVACVQDKPALLSLADVWSSRAAGKLSDARAFYNDTIEITESSVGHVSPYHSPSGVYAVQALIAQAMGDMVSYQSAIHAFVAASNAPCNNLDLTLGRSGTLLACAILNEALMHNALVDASPLMTLGHQTLHNLWEQINSFPAITECKSVYYTGVAHGWAGLLYATLRWCESSGVSMPAQVEERLHQLALLAEPRGGGLRWFSVVKTLTRRGGYYMPGWCNGSAGFVFLWTLAHKLFKDNSYAALAEQVGLNAWEEPDLVAQLCCGLAGRAYAMLNLFNHTTDPIWLDRAQQLANTAAINIQRELERYDGDSFSCSLYKGEAGLAVLAADLEVPHQALMPFFEG